MLGANDGIVSTASLILGVAAATPLASAARATDIVIAGVAGLVAGALSMAAGEYVSVSAQADTEKAEIVLERGELATDPAGELAELAGIYAARGVYKVTALAVATQLMAKDALGAHKRDGLNLSNAARAKPVQAAFASAVSFTVGAAMPLVAVFIAPERPTVWQSAATVDDVGDIALALGRSGRSNGCVIRPSSFEGSLRSSRHAPSA